MDKAMKKFVTIETTLMVAKILAAPIIMVVVEQVKGPRYAASASEIMIYVVISIALLGLLSQRNLAKAMNYIPEQR